MSSAPPQKRRKLDIVYEEDLEDEYDENCYGDQKDKAYLLSLSELEREDILFKRWETRERNNKLKAIAQQEGRLQSRKMDLRSSHDSRGKSSKKVALEELGRKRRTQSNQRKFEEEDSFTPPREEEIRKKKKVYRPEFIPSYRQIKPLTLSRYSLAKYIHARFFKKMIEGCFVRLLVGGDKHRRKYILAKIDSITTSGVYNLDLGGNRNLRTDKYLVLEVYGKKKKFQVSKVSNDPISEEEFGSWVQNMKKMEQEFPSENELRNLGQKIVHYTRKPQTEEDIKFQVEETKKFTDYSAFTLETLIKKKAQLAINQQAGELSTEESKEYQKICRAIERKKMVSEANIEKKKPIKIAQPKPVIKKPKKKRTSLQWDPFARKSSESTFFQKRPKNSEKLTVAQIASPQIGDQESPSTTMFQSHAFDLGIDLNIDSDDQNESK